MFPLECGSRVHWEGDIKVASDELVDAVETETTAGAETQ